MPREVSVISRLHSFIDLNFRVVHAATRIRYADGNEMNFIYLGPITLFSYNRLTTSSGKHIESISHAYFVSLMYKIIKSVREPHDLSIGFDRDRQRRQRELTNNKNIKGKYHFINMLKDVFGFAENQKKAQYGFQYQLTLTRNSDNSIGTKIMQSTLVKVKVLLLNVLYRFVHLRFRNKLYYLNRFQIKCLQSFDMWRDPFL